jgi:hypothetical protein
MDAPRQLRAPLIVGLLVAALVSGCLPAGSNPGAADPTAAPLPAQSVPPAIGTTLPANAGPTAEPEAALEGPDGAAILGPAASLAPVGGALNPPIVPAPSAGPALPRPTQPFAMNLYSTGDFVAQYTFEWCVGASIQMALNMRGRTDDRSRARQEDLWELAQSLSESPFGGANARGWTRALNVVGAGPYELVSEPDLDSAMRRAAGAIRETRRPVGLLMWRGRHAWVMSGFTSLGDPASVPNFEVTGVRVLDPLYPHGDDVWGASPKPNALLAPARLGEQFVARLHGRVDYGIPPGYFLVLPVSA